MHLLKITVNWDGNRLKMHYIYTVSHKVIDAKFILNSVVTEPNLTKFLQHVDK